MPISAMQLQAFRTREFGEAATRLAKMGSSTSIYKTISGVQVSIEVETGDGDAQLKQDCLEKGVQLVAAAGFALPDLSFYLTNAAGVECVAFMGNAAGARHAQIFLGPKLVIKNPKDKRAAVAVVGGSGTKGARGIADQEYDGTQRWFGNPKLHAQGTTIVVHELGHVLHELMDEQSFWTHHEPATMAGPAIWGAASVEVSQYATKLPLEFCAEVFAGTIAGKKYSQTVKIAYRALGGPEVPNFF